MIELAGWTDTSCGGSKVSNMLKSPRAGLLFIQLGASPKRLRVNGRCDLIETDTPKGQKLIVQLEADEIFPNCPRYIPELSKEAPSPYLPDASGTGVKPNWKNLPNLRDNLPKNDPHRD